MNSASKNEQEKIELIKKSIRMKYAAESLRLSHWCLKTSSDVIGRPITSKDVVEQRWKTSSNVVGRQMTSSDVFGRPTTSDDAFLIFLIFLFFFINNFCLLTLFFLKVMRFSYKIMINIFNYCFFTIINNLKLFFYFKTLTIDEKILIFWKSISYLSMYVNIDF